MDCLHTAQLRLDLSSELDRPFALKISCPSNGFHSVGTSEFVVFRLPVMPLPWVFRLVSTKQLWWSDSPPVLEAHHIPHIPRDSTQRDRHCTELSPHCQVLADSEERKQSISLDTLSSTLSGKSVSVLLIG